MINYGVAISLTLISIFALFTDILAIFVIAHYFPFLHGTDVTLISLMCAMAGNAILVLPIPAFVEILDIQWSSALCTGYVWSFLTFRLSQMLSLAILTIHWSTLLKMSAVRKGYFSTKLLKISVVFVWISSIIFGCLPLIGVADSSYNKDDTCKFLSFNLGTGFGLFFIIANIALILVSIICATDATLLIKHMKKIAKSKYSTNRVAIPDSRADIPGQVTDYMTERYHRLNFAWDLSKFVLVFVLLAFLLNHLPYTIIQGLQVFTQIDRGALEVTSLYLVGAEALIIPHSLWFLSKRYRHGLQYLWRVHVLRKTEEREEDQCSCLLQSYTQREKDRVSVAPSRPPSSQGRAGGYSVSASGTLRSNKSDVMGRELLQPNGRTQITTLPSPKTHKHVVHVNGAVRGEVIEPLNNSYEERGIDTRGLEINRSRTPTGSDRSESNQGQESVTRNSNPNTPQTLSVARLDAKRSSSGASRKEWKENMKMKHLPPIFVNDGFETKDKKCTLSKKEEIQVKDSPLIESTNSLHYYMSSDYHPDYLTDSLPRHKIAQALSIESEDDDTITYKARRVYEDNDIEEALIASSPTDKQYWIKRREQFMNAKKQSSEDQRPLMSTFKAPFDDYKISSIDKTNGLEDLSRKGVYGTYEDLSVSNVPAESEIVFNVGSIPADHMRDGYNSLRRIKRKEGDMVGSDLQNGLNNSFSGQTRESVTPTNSPDFRSLGRSKKRFMSNPVFPMQSLETKLTEINDRFYFGATNFTENKPRTKDSSPVVIHQPDSGTNIVFQTDSSRQVYSSTGLFRNDSRRLSDRFSLEDSASASQPNSSNTSNTESQIPTSSIEDGNVSSGSSNSSVTISPYIDGMRHKPWLDDLGSRNSDRVLLQMAEPLVVESDTDTIKDINDSLEFRVSDGKHPHSNMSTPVSSLFDEETDRGFEEALDQHVNIGAGASVYGGVGLCFESIKEEPEDLTSSGSNQFLDTVSNGEDEFRTLAVVSRNSSRPSSVASVEKGDTSYLYNTQSVSQMYSKDNRDTNKVNTYLYRDAEYDFEHGDSGFTSGLEKGNWSDSSGYQDVTPRTENISPWPDQPDVIVGTNNAFESNFCYNERSAVDALDISDVVVSTNPSKYPLNQVYTIDSGSGPYSQRKLNTNVQSTRTSKRPMNRVVNRVVSATGQPVVRVRSLDDNSPVAPRRQPKRVSSFEIRTDVKPAYF